MRRIVDPAWRFPDNKLMNKVLLVYEDYSELMSLEGLLKRLSFDVIGLTSEYTVAEQVLAFNPDIVVGSGRGGKVSSIGVGKRLKEMTRWQGKSILIFPPNFKPTPPELMRIRVDMVLEAPVLNARVVQVIGRLVGQDEKDLLDRLAKLSSSESQHRDSFVSQNQSDSQKYSASSEAIYVRGTAIDGDENSETSATTDKPGKFKFDLTEEISRENRPGTKKETSADGNQGGGSDASSNPSSELKSSSARQESDSDDRRHSKADALQKDKTEGKNSDKKSALGNTDKENNFEDDKDVRSSLSSLNPDKESRAADSEDSFAESFASVDLKELEAELLKAGSPANDPLSSELQNNKFSEESSESTEVFDLKALEEELLRAAPPEDTPGDALTTPFSEPSLDAVETEVLEMQTRALADLAEATEKLRKKMAKYAAIQLDAKVPTNNQMTRVEVRKRQKALQADWDLEKNSQNDKLRRDFTTALFTKKPKDPRK